MRNLRPPFKFALENLLERARSICSKHVGGVSIKLPFLALEVDLKDPERRVARELVVKLSDRRVLNAWECCDGCIDSALTSLQQIRAELVQAQSALAEFSDGAVLLLTELMLEAVRQFLTFEQRIAGGDARQPSRRDPHATHRYRENQELYFAGLEMLRAHLHRCITQLATIAGMQIPTIPAHMRYDEIWQLDAYARPAFASQPDVEC